jgi:glycosyltransferase involved in cell wall biosynthesis
MPEISVIIPVYKVEKYLERCIDSVLAQTFVDFECILVNDGSPDNCPLICDEYAKKDRRIKVVHKENGGVSSARNAGLDIAQGEWITFIDSDDWVDEEYLELMYNNAVKNNCDLSICRMQMFDENSETVKENKPSSIMFFDKNFAKKTLLGFKHFTTSAVCKLVKRTLVCKNNVRFDTSIKICEDGLFWFEIIDKIDRIVYDSTSCYNYLQHENSALYSPKAVDNYMTNFIATKKMAEIETNKSVLRKIKSYEALVARYLCSILSQPDRFVKEKYDFYRKRLQDSFFYYIIDGDIRSKDKIKAIKYLFPRKKNKKKDM